jgi:hypothetical protein
MPAVQKLRWLQNALSGIPDLARVKQLGDQNIAHGLPPLTYEKYMDVLLSACSSYDLLRDAPANSRRAVYSTTFMTMTQKIQMTLMLMATTRYIQWIPILQTLMRMQLVLTVPITTCHPQNDQRGKRQVDC